MYFVLYLYELVLVSRPLVSIRILGLPDEVIYLFTVNKDGFYNNFHNIFANNINKNCLKYNKNAIKITKLFVLSNCLKTK